MHLQLNDEHCPVSDDVFGRLRQASPPDAVGIARSLPSLQRAQLAVFCYRRRHLHELGLVIASTCERSELATAAPGAPGMVIYDQSRDSKKLLAVELGALADQGPKPISLASL
jgi:hypothetical protein